LRPAPRAVFWTVCSLLAGGAGAWAAPATDAVLENAGLRVVVGATGGAHLAALARLPEGRELLRPGSHTPLYQVEIGHGSQVLTIDAGQADSTRLDRPDAATVVLTSRHARYGLEVVNTIRLAGDAAAAELFTEVRRQGDEPSIRIIRTPGLAVPLAGAGGASSALLPVADGEVIADLATALRDGETRSWNYPGIASAQLMALYDARGGVVVWTADAAGQFKRLALRRSGADVLTYFEHITIHMKGPRVAVPYPVRLAAFEGGWEQAADRYRDWAVTQPWCARLQEARARQGALRLPSFFLGVNVREAKGSGAVDRSAAIPAHAAAWSRGLGMPVTAILLSWEKHGAWITPDAFPPYGGDTAFAALVGGLHGAGNDAMMYLSGLNVTMEKSARNGAPAYRLPASEVARLRPVAIVDPGGAVHIEGTAAGDGIGRHAVLCPATPQARQQLEGGLDRSLALGADIVQVDQIPGGGTPPCFAPTHGHPPGGGTTAFDGLARILDTLRRRAEAARRGAAISLEEPGELYLQHVDITHCRDYMQGLWPRDGRGSTGVPLFAYLYHDYGLGYGGDSAPIAARGEDPRLALYAQAMNLAAGRLPGAAVWMKMIAWDDVHPALAAFMKDAAGLWRSDAGRYLASGRIVDLDIDPGRQEVTGRAGNATRSFVAPALMARGFELHDGTRGLLYINATDAPRATRLGFGPGRDGARAVSVWPAAGTPIAAGTLRTMKPREILFLRVEGP